MNIGGFTFYDCGCLINGNWHNIRANEEEKVKALKEEAPINSEVEFQEEETKRDDKSYWNFIPDSFKIIKKGDGIRKSFGKGFSEEFEGKRIAANCATAIVCSMAKNEKGQPFTKESIEGILTAWIQAFATIHPIVKGEKEGDKENEKGKEGN